MTQAKPRHSCRVCGSGELRPFLDLGSQPLANGLLHWSELKKHEPLYPLALDFCGNCGMVQLSHVVPAEDLYSEYPFHTASSAVMVEHFGKLMRDSVPRFVPHDGLVVEIGSNDGSALASLRGFDVRVLGVDPSDVDAGDVPTEKAFFSADLANVIAEREGMAHLIVACNVLAHVDDLHDFLKGIRTLLHSDGAFIIEVPHFGAILQHGAYDQIYHEHLSQFSVSPLKKLLEMHGLNLFSIEFFPVHGGTMRVTARINTPDEPFPDIHHRTYRPDIAELAYFADRVQRSRNGLLKQLTALRAAGKRIIGYGASAKGAVVLNYCGIEPDLVPMVIDNTPVKRGKFMPGTWQEIIGEDEVCIRDFDAVLLLAWNHREEIQRKLNAVGYKGMLLVPHD